MGYFVYDDEVERIDFEDGEWVKIKRTLSYDDVEKVGTKLAAGDQASFVPVLAVAIKEWSFKDRDGNVAPVNEEYIRRLDPQVAGRLVEEVLKRNPFIGATSMSASGRSSGARPKR